MDIKIIVAVFGFVVCVLVQIAEGQVFRGEIFGGNNRRLRFLNRPTTAARRRRLRNRNRNNAARRRRICTRRQRLREQGIVFFNTFFEDGVFDEGLCANLVVTPPPTTRAPRTRPPTTTPRPSRETTAIAPLPSASTSELARRVDKFLDDDEEMIPNLVQMVFHSCVGGCDGCLNLDEPDNKGLRESYPIVKEFCEKQMQPMTLADCVVFMASKAVEKGMHKNDELEGVTVPFRSGRQTCPDPDNYNMNFEFPKGDHTDSLEFLQREFKLTQKQAIALMGAHSLGRCKKENSGFDGPWDFTELKFDNGYYKSMLGTEWVVRNISGKTQWTTSKDNNRMMLHADVALARRITFDRNGNPTCSNAKDCPRRDTADQCGTYSRNQLEWAKDFVEAFVIMVTRRR